MEKESLCEYHTHRSMSLSMDYPWHVKSCYNHFFYPDSRGENSTLVQVSEDSNPPRSQGQWGTIRHSIPSPCFHISNLNQRKQEENSNILLWAKEEASVLFQIVHITWWDLNLWQEEVKLIGSGLYHLGDTGLDDKTYSVFIKHCFIKLICASTGCTINKYFGCQSSKNVNVSLCVPLISAFLSPSLSLFYFLCVYY